MADLKERIYTILGEFQMSSLATITQDGKPWVRYVMTVASKDLTIRCATFKNARKVKQTARNPEVHLTCGITDPKKTGPYLQVQGRATTTTSREARHGFWNDIFSTVFDGPDDPNLAIMEIKPYYIEYVTPGTFEPEVWKAE
jgi:general stress protein 26